MEIVDEFPAMLIMARLADKISDLRGLPAISDVPWAFALNRAIELGLANKQLRRGYFAHLIMKASIPAHLGLISDSEFERIRLEYEGVRALFSSYIRECSVNYLEDPREFDEFIKRAREVASEFRREIRRVRSSTNGQFIRRWIGIPLSLCSFVMKTTLNPTCGIAADTLQVAMDISKEVGLIGPRNSNHLAKVMSGMRNEIAYSANFMRWIGDT